MWLLTLLVVWGMDRLVIRVFNSVKDLSSCFLKWQLLFWIHTFRDREFLLSYKALWTLNSICVCVCSGVRMRRGGHFNWCFNIPSLFGHSLKYYNLVCKHWNLNRRLESLPPSVTDSWKLLRLKEKGWFSGVLSEVEVGCRNLHLVPLDWHFHAHHSQIKGHYSNAERREREGGRERQGGVLILFYLFVCLV